MKMNLILPIYIFSLSFVSVIYSDKSPEENTKEFIELWSSLTSNTVDVTAELKLISGVAKEVLKLAGPIANLIAAGLDIALKPQSPEYIALLKLSHEVGTKFALLESRVNASFASLRNDLNMDQYTIEVRVPLGVAFTVMPGIINPTIPKSETQITAFKQSCLGTSRASPPQISKYLFETVVDPCTKNPLNVNAYHRFAEIIPRCPSTLHEKYIYNVEEVEMDIIRHFVSLNQSIAERFVEELAYESNQIVCGKGRTDGLIQLLSQMRLLSVKYSEFKIFSANTPCLPDIVAISNKFKGLSMVNFDNMIRKDVARTTLYAITCANITAGHNKKTMDDYLNPILYKLLNITHFGTNYSNKLLKSSILTIERTKIHDIIGQVVPEGTEFTTKAQVIEIGQKMKVELAGIGHTDYYRQFFVSLNYMGTFLRPHDYEVAVYCPKPDCDTINYRNIFVINARFNLTNRDRTYGLRANVEELTKNVTDYLDTHYWFNLDQIKDYVLANFKAIDVDFQRHFFIARVTSAHSANTPVIYVEYYLSENDKENEQRSAWPIVYKEQGFWLKGRTYQFWFTL